MINSSESYPNIPYVHIWKCPVQGESTKKKFVLSILVKNTSDYELKLTGPDAKNNYTLEQDTTKSKTTDYWAFNKDLGSHDASATTVIYINNTLSSASIDLGGPRPGSGAKAHFDDAEEGGDTTGGN